MVELEVEEVFIQINDLLRLKEETGSPGSGRREYLG